MKNIQKVCIILMVIVLVFSFAGCRKRIVDDAVHEGQVKQEIKDNAEDEIQKTKELLGQTEKTDKEEIAKDSEETVEIVSEKSSTLSAKSSGKDDGEKKKAVTGSSDQKKTGDSDGNGESNGKGNGSGEAKDPSAASDENKTSSDKSDTKETEADKYREILNSRIAGLYPCQRYYAYIETATAYRTVNRNSDLHTAMEAAGFYNVAELVKENNLSVENDWIVEQNPDAIVKFVDSSVLGAGIQDTSAAQQVYQSLVSRDGWSDINAVSSSNVIIVSDQLMNSENGKLVTEMYLAKAMHPTLFKDVKMNQMIETLLGEEYNGKYVYIK